MNQRIIRRYFSILVALATVSVLRAAESTVLAETIEADVAQLIAGINAHDVAKATAYDAPDVISMECGRPSSVGIEADREGLKMGFTQQPYWKVSLVDEAVEVANDGDLAVYRGIYNEDNRRGDVELTHRVNFIAEFKRQKDGSWKIAWYIVSEMERSHPKR